MGLLHRAFALFSVSTTPRANISETGLVPLINEQ